MKLSDGGFDARRLRPRGPATWRWRLVAALAALFAAFGILLAMAGAVVLLMALVLPLTLSGYATYNEWGGEWLEEVHEFVGEFFLWTVLTHLGLLLGLSLLRRKNQALPMLTGRIEGNGPDFAKRNHVWLAGLLLVAVLGYWAWEWQQAPIGLSGPAASSWTDRHPGHDEDD